MYKTFGLCLALLVLPRLVSAESCQPKEIASFTGPVRSLGDVYYDRTEFKFWKDNFSPKAIELEVILPEESPLTELKLRVNCDKTVWLFPIKAERVWTKIGRVKDQPLLLKLFKNDKFWEGIILGAHFFR